MGRRRILKTLCEQAEIEPLARQPNYFQPHGGRRGTGDTIYRKQDTSVPQQLLRHQDPRTTAEPYQQIDTSETAKDVGDVFEETDK
jgi:integrase